MPSRLLPVGMWAIMLVFIGIGCESKWKSMEVTATAYTTPNAKKEKDKHNVTAWGHRLEPGMKAIAVSRDLIPLGLTNETKVKIKGFKGEYLVLDKMNKRWHKKIDIYFGHNRKAADEWGKRPVIISWNPKLENPSKR